MLSAELNSFSVLLIYLIDKGEKEELEVIEDKKEKIVEYIIKKYDNGIPMFRNVNAQSVQEFINEQYVSESDSRDRGIDNNGLLYLLELVINYISNELFDFQVNE